MNILVSNKLKEIEEYKKFECWYLVKQDATFWKQCYYASILNEYNKNGDIQDEMNFEGYFGKKIEELNKEKGLRLSKTHRAVRVGYFYGLITIS